MSILDKLSNILYDQDYWESYLQKRKIKSVLDEFFKSEDEVLQKAFIDNFDFPVDMVSPPVKYQQNTGDIYWVLNFKSKDLFDNTGTKETAYSNSLAILDKLLPLGIVHHLEPDLVMTLPGEYSLLCSLKISSNVTTTKSILSILKILSIISSISVIIFYSLKYFN